MVVMRYSIRKTLWVVLPVVALVSWWAFRSLVSVNLLKLLPKSRGVVVAMEDGAFGLELMRSRGLLKFMPMEMWEIRELFPYMGRCAIIFEDGEALGLFLAERGDTKALMEGAVEGVKLELLSKVPIPLWGFATSDLALERVRNAYLDPSSRISPARKTKGPNVVIAKMDTGDRVEISWSFHQRLGQLGFSVYAPLDRFLGEFPQREFMAPELRGKEPLMGFIAMEGRMGAELLKLFPSLSDLLGESTSKALKEGLPQGKRLMVVLSGQGVDLFREGLGYQTGGDELSVPEDMKDLPLHREALSLALNRQGIAMISPYLGDRVRGIVSALRPVTVFFRVLSPTRGEGRVFLEP